jgi:hypothetical protein
MSDSNITKLALANSLKGVMAKKSLQQDLRELHCK